MKDNLAGWRSSFLLAIIALVGSLPLLAMPIHVDDPLYLGVASQILKTPWDPFHGSAPWNDGDWYACDGNPPLWSYALAIVAATVGWNAVALHALAAGAYALAVFGLHRISSRVSSWPLVWTLAIAFAPALLPGRNLMLDVPMLAAWLWSLEWAFRDWEGDRPGSAWLAGCLAAGAVLTKYTALLLIPIFAIGAWRYRKPRSCVAILPVAIAFAVWTLQNCWFHGRPHFGSASATGAFVSLERWRVALRVSGAMIGWAPLAVIALTVLVGRRWGRAPAFLALAAILVVGGIIGVGDGWDVAQRLGDQGVPLTTWRQSHFVVMSANGWIAFASAVGLAILALTSSAADARARQVVGAWMAIAWLFNAVAVPTDSFGATRHLIGYVVAGTLVVASPIESALGGFAFGRLLLGASVLATAVVGFALADADRAIASVSKTVGERFVAARAAAQPTWVVGDPSLRYYGERNGGRVWRRGVAGAPAPSVGELVATTSLQAPWLRYDRPPAGLAPRSIEPVVSRNPFRTIGPLTNFYGGNASTLPWELEPATGDQPPLDVIILLK